MRGSLETAHAVPHEGGLNKRKDTLSTIQGQRNPKRTPLVTDPCVSLAYPSLLAHRVHLFILAVGISDYKRLLCSLTHYEIGVRECESQASFVSVNVGGKLTGFHTQRMRPWDPVSGHHPTHPGCRDDTMNPMSLNIRRVCLGDPSLSLRSTH